MSIIKTIADLRLELYQKLSVAEAESKSSAPRISHEDLMKNLRNTINRTKI